MLAVPLVQMTPGSVPAGSAGRMAVAWTDSPRQLRKVSRVSARPSSTTVPAVVKSTCAGITEQAENSVFRVVTIDTTGRTPEQSFDEILLKSEPMVTFGELALRALPVPGGKQQVVYRHGVRTLVPAAG